MQSKQLGVLFIICTAVMMHFSHTGLSYITVLENRNVVGVLTDLTPSALLVMSQATCIQEQGWSEVAHFFS